MAAAASFAVACMLLALGACGGSSPTTPNPPPPPPPPTISFFSDDDEATENAIVLAITTADASMATLTLNANGVTDLFGFGLDIVFDPAFISLSDATAGVFFDADGIAVSSQAVESTPGRLVIGQTRVGNVAGVTGTGVLYTLTFTAVAPGTTTIAIQNAGALDGTGAAMTLQFVGGTANVPVTER